MRHLRSWSNFIQCIATLFGTPGYCAEPWLKPLLVSTVPAVCQWIPNNLLILWPLTSARHHNCPLMGMFSTLRFTKKWCDTMVVSALIHLEKKKIIINHFVKPHASGRLLGLLLWCWALRCNFLWVHPPPTPPTWVRDHYDFFRHNIIWVWCRFCSQQKSPSYQANLLYNWVPFIFSSERQEYHSLFSTKSICWKSSQESGLKFAVIHIFISFQSFIYLKGKWQNWKETEQQQPDWGFGPTMTWSRWDLGNTHDYRASVASV